MNGVVKRDSFKIVYVAPMKALAAEMTANFGKRLAPLGITGSILLNNVCFGRWFNFPIFKCPGSPKFRN